MGWIVFSHANGFPAPTYGLLFEAWRAAGWRVTAVEAYGHDERFPVGNNWARLRDELLAHLDDHLDGDADADAARPFLIGHSLGGFLSLMAASRRPAQVRGVVLLDSPLIAGWRAHSLHMAKLGGLVERMAPSKVSRARRESWPDLAAVQSHFEAKAVFARWHPQVLADYAHHGTVDAEHDGQPGRRLRFDRRVETRIYDTLPHQLQTVLRRHPLRCPVAFIGGTRSAELRKVGLAATRALTQGRVSMLDGTHLFPFEQPLETAGEVLRVLGEMQS